MSDITNSDDVVCRLLRTKRAFGSSDDPANPWHQSRSTTSAYWCLETMEPAGLDDQIAHPDLCRQGRGCFRTRDD
ncbi:MAG: hypothetical protein ACLQU2_18260 [Candidatus Binataceae bacterium]